VAGEDNPPVRRRELGAVLRALRTDAGLTVEELAGRLLCSTTKVSRMETGQRGVSARDIRDLCQVYGITDIPQYDHLMSLAEQGRGQSWWQPLNLPHADYIGLEAAAISVSDFEPGVVPGLLQTPGYARAIHEAGIQHFSPAEINERIGERLNRQKILSRANPTLLHAIIDEAVLHRAVGGPAVMAAQLDQLIETSSNLPNVTIQVLPFSAGAHPALDSTFIMLDMAAPVASVVYVEGLVGWIYLDKAQELDRYEQVFERLRDISLPSEQSLELISRTKQIFQE
jgi:transcriptional regulator with XRE-family HTH domain